MNFFRVIKIEIGNKDMIECLLKIIFLKQKNNKF